MLEKNHPAERASLSRRFQTIRLDKKLSQTDFAARLGVSQRTVSRIEKGERFPKSDLLEKVCDEFGVSLSWLVRGEHADAGPPGREMSHEELAKVLADALKTAEAETGYAARRRLGVIPLFHIGGDEPTIQYAGDLPAREAAEYIPAPSDVSDPDAFACRFHGDSMVPVFEEGHILLFSPATEVRSGDYACVRLDDTSTFRRIFFPDEDQVRLVALNPQYPELRIPRRDVRRLFRLVWRLSQF